MLSTSNTKTMRILYLLVTFLVLLAHANARNVIVFRHIGENQNILIFHGNAEKSTVLDNGISLHGPSILDPTSQEEVPSFGGLHKDLFCQSCLEISRKAEEILADSELLEKADKISTEICQILPSTTQDECVELLETYIQQAIDFLREYLDEEKLCNSTGLCNGTISSNGVAYQNEAQSWFLTKMDPHMFANKLSDDKACITCHSAVDEVLKELQNPEAKMEVLKILLKACENVDNHVKECKKLVFEYAPLVMANLEKFVTKNDLCTILHVCNGAAPHTAETTDVNTLLIALPHTRVEESKSARMAM